VAERAGADSDDAGAVAAAARDGEFDRYLAALLAPSGTRPGLLALAAFSAEIARVPLVAAREPAIGEIRLQWWRDALDPTGSAVRTGAPVADALRAAVARHGLPRALLDGMIDARSFELTGELFADEASLRDYLWKSEGAPFALAARIIAPSLDTDADGAAIACSYAYGLTRLLLALPRTLSLGRVPLPQSRLDTARVKPEELLAGEASDAIAHLLEDLRAEARSSLVTSRQHVASLPRAIRTAFLPLALVEPYLRALERPGRDLLRGPAEIVPLTRVWRIVMAHWLGRA
jgi:15-cis-phytoene synthase